MRDRPSHPLVTQQCRDGKSWKMPRAGSRTSPRRQEAGRQRASRNAGPAEARALTQPRAPQAGGRQDPLPGRLAPPALQSHPEPVWLRSPTSPSKDEAQRPDPHARPQMWRLALKAAHANGCPEGRLPV